MMTGSDSHLVRHSGKHLEFRETDEGWEYADRPFCKGAVAILAVTEDRKVILVEQYRPPVDRKVIELPAGLAGDIPLQGDEPLVVAAKRELKEEAGYIAKDWRILTEGPSSAGMSTEFVSIFHASGLTKVNEGGGNSTEDIRVHFVDLLDVPSWCARKQAEGLMVDFKIFSALYLAKLKTNSSDSRVWI